MLVLTMTFFGQLSEDFSCYQIKFRRFLWIYVCFNFIYYLFMCYWRYTVNLLFYSSSSVNQGFLFLWSEGPFQMFRKYIRFFFVVPLPGTISLFSLVELALFVF